MTDIDIAGVTGGRFVPRVTADGPPDRFTMDAMTLVVGRGDAEQRIDAASMLGAVALCATDGRVFGYGTCDVDDLEGLADAVEVDGHTDGEPIARLAAAGLVLALPLDAMPDDVRDMFLGERVEPAILEMTMLDQTSLDEARRVAGGGHEHEHHHHAETLPDVDDVVFAVDMAVEAHGHGIVGTSSQDMPRAYTVGLAEGGWPELILTGLAERGSILNHVVGALRTRDMRPTDGTEIHGAVSVPLRLRELQPAATAWLGVAVDRARRRGGGAITAVQVVWPDADGFFPGEPDYDEETFPQPML